MFKIENGVESILYSFCSITNCPDGAFPVGQLTRDAAGNLYGIAGSGFHGEGPNVVYQLTPAGAETVIRAGTSLGYTLAIDRAGNLYGVSGDGGKAGLGSVYKLTRN